MGAYGMLLILVGCMVGAQIIKAFLTWRPKDTVNWRTNGRRVTNRNR